MGACSTVALLSLTATSAGGLDSVESLWIPRARASIRLDTRVALDTSHDREGEQVGELWVGGKLVLDVEMTPELTAYAAPRFMQVSTIDRDGRDREYLYLDAPEADVAWTFGPFRLRAGNIVFNWGASDLIAPSDVLNPIDLRTSVTGSSEDAKIPVLAVELRAILGSLTLRAVVAPVFTASRFFLSGFDSSLGQASRFYGFTMPDLELAFGAPTLNRIEDELVITDRPAARPDHATIGGRATLSLERFDLSATGVYGWEPLPRLVVDPDLSIVVSRFAESFASGRAVSLVDSDLLEAIGRIQEKLEAKTPLLEGTYERRGVLGLDVVGVFDPFVLKVDAAFSFSRTLYTQDFRPVSRPWLNAVVGVEYQSTDALQVVVEAFALSVFGVPSDYRLLFLESRLDAGSVPDPAPDPDSAPDSRDGARVVVVPGLASAVRVAMLDGDLRFELGVVSTLTRGDLILLPAIRQRLAEGHELALGGLAIQGRRDGYGGVFGHNDQVYVEYRFSR